MLSGVSNSEYYEMAQIDELAVRTSLKEILDVGITSLAIVLAHSFACPEHEIQVGAIAAELGFTHITLSHQAMPMIRLVNRGYTACAEAYLEPQVERYLESFTAGFKNKLAGVDVLFMQSDGGLTNMESFRGARAILSGPAGGVVGYAFVCVYCSSVTFVSCKIYFTIPLIIYVFEHEKKIPLDKMLTISFFLYVDMV